MPTAVDPAPSTASEAAAAPGSCIAVTQQRGPACSTMLPTMLPTATTEASVPIVTEPGNGAKRSLTSTANARPPDRHARAASGKGGTVALPQAAPTRQEHAKDAVRAALAEAFGPAASAEEQRCVLRELLSEI